ncbi:MAG: hypothetical protein P1Q69_18925 [Candidatus Thorarchaeota archaeon]|nr:hypothetical protein [Candidatus Thorarchaeota archaeon]
MDITFFVFLTTSMLSLAVGLLLILLARFLVTHALSDSKNGIGGMARTSFSSQPYLFMVIVFILPLIGTLVMWIGYIYAATELSVQPFDGFVISGIVALGLWGIFNISRLNSARLQGKDVIAKSNE